MHECPACGSTNIVQTEDGLQCASCGYPQQSNLLLWVGIIFFALVACAVIVLLVN